MHPLRRLPSLLPPLVAIGLQVASASPAAFVYQGRLESGGQLAEGTFDFEFRCFDAAEGGTNLGLTLHQEDVRVDRGQLVVTLDFGESLAAGPWRWLEIALRPGSSTLAEDFVTLSPRHELTSTPFSYQAERARSADAVSGQGGSPGQVLKFNGTSTYWADDDPGPSYWQAAGTNVYYNLGRVGIGRTSPRTSLELQGTTGLRVSTGQNSAVYGDILHGYSDGLILNSQAGGSFAEIRLQTDGTTRLFVASSGNVGIGTDAPAQRLHVLGSGSFTSRVGIGIQNPSAGLHISGTTFPDSFLYLQSADPGDAGIRIYEGPNVRWHLYHSSSDQLLRIEDNNGHSILNAEASEGVVVIGGTLAHTNKTASVNIKPETDRPYGLAVHPGAFYGLRADGVYGGVSAHATGPGSAGVITSGSSVGVAATGSSTTGRGVWASGEAYDFIAAGAGINYGAESSIRWKQNVTQIQEPLIKLDQLRGVTFTWDAAHGGRPDIGMIAEEVGQVLPEIVGYEPDGTNAVALDYSKLTPLLVEAIKGVRAETQAELDALRAENADLRARLARLEAAAGLQPTTETVR